MMAVVKDGFRNVPEQGIAAVFFQCPGNMGMETYFWDTPHDPPSVADQIRQALTAPVPVVARSRKFTPLAIRSGYASACAIGVVRH